MDDTDAANKPRLVLASRSPRRVEILRDAGFQFEIDPADIDEENYPRSHSPADVARLLAIQKANSVAVRHPNSVVLAADTVVFANGKLYGKAETSQDARNMLSELTGEQQVITAIAVVDRARKIERIDHAVSIVHMRPMLPAELDAYIASNDWRGKAGAYGIQDVDPQSDPFVRIIEGDFSNVVGLPIDLVRQMLDGLL